MVLGFHYFSPSVGNRFALEGSGEKPKKPFQPEPPEGGSAANNPCPKKMGKKMFQPEPEEQSSSDSDSSASVMKEPSVFNFGWHSLHLAEKARFSKSAGDMGKRPKPKRAYNNSGRASQATLDRSKSKSFRDNGLSEQRLLHVLAKDECLCALPMVGSINGFLFMYSNMK